MQSGRLTWMKCVDTLVKSDARGTNNHMEAQVAQY